MFNQEPEENNQLATIEQDDSQHTMPLMSAINGTDGNADDDALILEEADESRRLAVQSALLIAIVALIAGGVVFGMRLTSGGAAAIAATEELAKIQSFIAKAENPGLVDKNDPQHPDKLRLMARGADALVKQISIDYAEKAVPVDEVAKNPFQLAGVNSSGPTPDAAAQQRQLELAALRNEFERFDLQSIMGSGARSVAVIDGEFYRVGARIGGFKIAGIQPGRVGLLPADLDPSADDPRFILEIQDPQADASPRY